MILKYLVDEFEHEVNSTRRPLQMVPEKDLSGFLFNHIYHHRGELIVCLRAKGNKIPGMYGPTYEESPKV